MFFMFSKFCMLEALDQCATESLPGKNSFLAYRWLPSSIFMWEEERESVKVLWYLFFIRTLILSGTHPDRMSSSNIDKFLTLGAVTQGISVQHMNLGGMHSSQWHLVKPHPRWKATRHSFHFNIKLVNFALKKNHPTQQTLFPWNWSSQTSKDMPQYTTV